MIKRYDVYFLFFNNKNFGINYTINYNCIILNYHDDIYSVTTQLLYWLLIRDKTKQKSQV